VPWRRERRWELGWLRQRQLRLDMLVIRSRRGENPDGPNRPLECNWRCNFRASRQRGKSEAVALLLPAVPPSQAPLRNSGDF
jgi:hypothetical protein